MADFLDSPIDPDLKFLLQTRRDQLMEYGDLAELGIFVIIQCGDTIAHIDAATGWPILMDGTPTFEWVKKMGTIWEMPFVLSDSGAGHVLILPDIAGIDPALLDLCRTYSDQPNGLAGEGSEGA